MGVQDAGRAGGKGKEGQQERPGGLSRHPDGDVKRFFFCDQRMPERAGRYRVLAKTSHEYRNIECFFDGESFMDGRGKAVRAVGWYEQPAEDAPSRPGRKARFV